MKFKVVSILLTTLLYNCASSENARVYGGYPIDITKVPCVVHIDIVLKMLANGQAKVYGCGGTIVRPNLILTAAHCTTNDTTGGLYNAGAYYVNSEANKKDLTDGSFHSVKTVYRHPQYKGGHEHHFFHDVGMLELVDNIQLGTKAQLVALAQPGDNPEVGTDCTVTGYGENPDHPNDKRLYQVHLSIISAQQCVKELAGGTVQEVEQHQICAQAKGKNQCQGDSGGPLHDTTTNRQVGIVSYGAENCTSDSPSILARVTDNLDFINDIISKTSTQSSVVAASNGNPMYNMFQTMWSKKNR